jgi:hypothetical protein
MSQQEKRWWPPEYETERQWAIACAITEGWPGTVEEYMELGLHRSQEEREGTES